MSFKAFKTALACTLSAAMLLGAAACGTTDEATSGSGSSSSSSTTGYDVSGIKKGDSATDEAVQKALQKLMDDGTYGKILKHWGAEGGAVTKAEINPKVED